MSNIQLPNDEIVFYPILELNGLGNVVPAISGDTFTITTTATDLNAVITTVNGVAGLQMNALVATASAVPLTISDADGLTAFTGAVDIVVDATPKAIGLDLANPTVVGSQPAPTAAAA